MTLNGRKELVRKLALEIRFCLQDLDKEGKNIIFDFFTSLVHIDQALTML